MPETYRVTRFGSDQGIAIPGGGKNMRCMLFRPSRRGKAHVFQSPAWERGKIGAVYPSGTQARTGRFLPHLRFERLECIPPAH